MAYQLNKLYLKIEELIKTKLYLKVLIGLFLGIITGILLSQEVGLVSKEVGSTISNWLAFPGHLFLQLVKMIIIPLIFASIITGLLGSGDKDFLKKIGPKIVVFFIFTTIIATLIGFAFSYMIKPGSFITNPQIEIENQITKTSQISDNIPKTIAEIIPSNPLESMVTGDMLGVVLFTIIFGISIFSLNPEQIKSTKSALEALQKILMNIIRWAMELAPYAVFGFMAQLTAQIGFDALKGLSMYVITVILGLLTLLLFYNALIFLFSNFSPKFFMQKIKGVMLLAFSTSSSAAVMPMSMKTAEEDLNIDKSISRFLIPIGATINMGGTALYQATATIFLAQVYNINLTISAMILIVVLTVAASIGAPSTPGVGIVILATILESVGIPAAGIALILGVDRILDMCRTSINVTGDLTAAVIFNKKTAYPN